MPEQAAIAKAIAIVAHQGQVDKAGHPYIGHPARVANRVATHCDPEALPDLDRILAVAWLHDVLEDTNITEEDLETAGIEHPIAWTVGVLTRQRGTTDEEYYRNILVNPTALAVKIADIEDNMDPRRLAQLDDATQLRLTKKYATALAALKGDL